MGLWASKKGKVGDHIAGQRRRRRREEEEFHKGFSYLGYRYITFYYTTAYRCGKKMGGGGAITSFNGG